MVSGTRGKAEKTIQEYLFERSHEGSERSWLVI